MIKCFLSCVAQRWDLANEIKILLKKKNISCFHEQHELSKEIGINYQDKINNPYHFEPTAHKWVLWKLDHMDACDFVISVLEEYGSSPCSILGASIVYGKHRIVYFPNIESKNWCPTSDSAYTVTSIEELDRALDLVVSEINQGLVRCQFCSKLYKLTSPIKFERHGKTREYMFCDECLMTFEFRKVMANGKAVSYLKSTH